MDIGLTEGDLATWQIVGAALEALDDPELEFLPEIIKSVHRKSGAKVGYQPGAFSASPETLQTLAMSLFAVVSSAVAYAAPKLFDTALTIASDHIKKRLEQSMDERRKRLEQGELRLSVEQVFRLVNDAAIEKGLSARTAKALADSAVRQLALRDGAQ